MIYTIFSKCAPLTLQLYWRSYVLPKEKNGYFAFEQLFCIVENENGSLLLRTEAPFSPASISFLLCSIVNFVFHA